MVTAQRVGGRCCETRRRIVGGPATEEVRRAMSLYWRVLLLNALVLVTATALLLFAPVTVSVPVLPREAWILVGGLVVSLVANALLLRLGFAPLRHLAHLMGRIDLLRPSQRLPIRGG